MTGHDVDLLITHSNEGDEKGVLQQILQHLDSKGMVLQGKIEKSTYTENVLQADTKGAYLRSTLDHFEKWIGIIQVKKEIRDGVYIKQQEKVQHIACKTDDKSDPEIEPTSTQEQPKTDLVDKKLQIEKTMTLPELHICSQSSRDWYARRVDLIVVPMSQFYYALVGWTGSKHFNRSLRLYAQRELNMKLSSHGLYDVNKVTILFFSSPVGSLCHTHGAVRRPSFVVRRPSYVVCRLCPP